MAADKYLKFAAVQGGPFSNTVRNISWQIPGGSVYDLHDSFLTVECTIDTPTDASVDYDGNPLTDCVYQIGVRYTGDVAQVRNPQLVKNVSMSCRARGMLENISRIDQLNDAIYNLTTSQRKNASWNYLAMGTTLDPSGYQHYGFFTESEKIGSVSSQYREAQVQISLNSLMDICNTRAYDARRLGESQIAAEMNFDLLEPYVIVPTPLDAASGLNNCDDVAPFGAGGTLDSLTVTAAAAGGGGAGQQGIRDLTDSPFWVGAKLRVATATQVAAAPAIAGSDFRITSIAVSDTGAITLGISPSVPMIAGDGYTGITLTALGDSTGVTLGNINWNTANITLKQLGAPPPVTMPMEIPYRTWRTLQDVGPTGIASFQRVYDIDASADGMIVCFPDSTNDISSVNADLDQYRVRVNNVDLTDRNVVVAPIPSPLYYDRTAAGLGAMGMQINNLQLTTLDETAVTYDAAMAGGNLKYIVSKLPQTSVNKAVQLSIECPGGDVRKITIFQAQPRVLEL